MTGAEPTTGSGRVSMFTALNTRNYRLWASGQIVSLVGTWMQRVAQDWLVLSLSDGNAFALGVVMALQFGPTLVLSMWGGVLADRYDKRRILIATQSIAALLGLILGLLDVSGHVQLWHVGLLALLLGCSSAIDAPVRQSFTIEMVGRERLSNAIALNSMTFNTARVIGPAVAGVLIAAVGTGWAFLINAGSFVAVLIGLLLMRAADLYPVPHAPREKGQVRAGVRYVFARPDLRLTLLIVVAASGFGAQFPLSLSVLTRNGFGGGADAYGMLTTILACGTLLGAGLAARRSRVLGLGALTGAAIAFGISLIVVGLMPGYLWVAIALVPAGVLSLTVSNAAMGIMQACVPAEMRGRVMGLYTMFFLGSTPVGSMILGYLANTVDPRAPLWFGGAITILVGILGSVLVAGGLRVTEAGDPGPPAPDPHSLTP